MSDFKIIKEIGSLGKKNLFEGYLESEVILVGPFEEEIPLPPTASHFINMEGPVDIIDDSDRGKGRQHYYYFDPGIYGSFFNAWNKRQLIKKKKFSNRLGSFLEGFINAYKKLKENNYLSYIDPRLQSYHIWIDNEGPILRFLPWYEKNNSNSIYSVGKVIYQFITGTDFENHSQNVWEDFDIFCKEIKPYPEIIKCMCRPECKIEEIEELLQKKLGVGSKKKSLDKEERESFQINHAQNHTAVSKEEVLKLGHPPSPNQASISKDELKGKRKLIYILFVIFNILLVILIVVILVFIFIPILAPMKSSPSLYGPNKTSSTSFVVSAHECRTFLKYELDQLKENKKNLMNNFGDYKEMIENRLSYSIKNIDSLFELPINTCDTNQIVWVVINIRKSLEQLTSEAMKTMEMFEAEINRDSGANGKPGGAWCVLWDGKHKILLQGSVSSHGDGIDYWLVVNQKQQIITVNCDCHNIKIDLFPVQGIEDIKASGWSLLLSGKKSLAERYIIVRVTFYPSLKWQELGVISYKLRLESQETKDPSLVIEER